MPKTRTLGAATLTLVLIAPLAGCDLDGTGRSAEPAARTNAARYTPPALTWAPCAGLPQTGRTHPALRCAALKVPLDYAEPDGEQIEIALVRLRSSGPAGTRVGSLVFNFGGPGASGVDTLAASTGDYATLRTRYDLVGFDPRGVGRSIPVRCLTDREQDADAAADSTPDTPQEEETYAREARDYSGKCRARAGRHLPHITTANVARDLDVMRRALGDAKLHYFGISYGTWLGANYAHQYPGKVGRLVLDAAMDTSLAPRESFLRQAAGFQKAFGNFAAWTSRQTGGEVTAAAITQRTGALLQSLDATPIRTSDPARPLTQNLAHTGILSALYSREQWPVLAEALVKAWQGDGSDLLALADEYNERGEDGRYTNGGDAFASITCADTTRRYTAEDVREALPRFTQASPLFGASQAWSLLGCAGWPFRGDESGRRVWAPNAAPTLVIGNTGDPATPYEEAPALVRQMGSAVLLTLNGEGHGAYATKNLCVRTRVNGYLLNGTVPPNGTTCA
ncbi:alpha/beta hydrolase [Actinomadura kijaniata]|uniref:alpha/beta hydrolase n=1 Tax=Actinomadura kijaniata TaxID=46161 RepID=UPI0008343EF6|nr:alpha/beta hydrolase [Actinomadura kijaniata]